MARVNRREVLSETDVQVVHCVNRCVRRGFLCGDDAVSGKNYDHRRLWIRNRLEFLAGVFGVEVLGFAVMSNHFHVVLRSRPDAVSEWSDAEVAKRWWNLFPSRRDEDGTAADPTEFELNAIVNDKVKLTEVRKRLGSISWFMRCTSEVIARRANSEDECTGRFWEGRFKATVLDSDEAVAACMAYVDLNPIRAGLAETLEDSDFTSGQERMADVKSSEEVSSADAKDVRVEHGARAGWLSPIAQEPIRKKVRSRPVSRRVSNKGCLPMSLPEYLQLVDWTGRQLHPGKRGVISKDVPSVIERLGSSAEIWIHYIRKFAARRHVRVAGGEKAGVRRREVSGVEKVAF